MGVILMWVVWMQVWMGTCMCAEPWRREYRSICGHMHDQARGWHQDFSLITPHTIHWGKSSHWTESLPVRLLRLGTLPWGSPVSSPEHRHYRCATMPISICMDIGDLNSRPHVCVTDILTMEPSPQPQVILLLHRLESWLSYSIGWLRVL